MASSIRVDEAILDEYIRAPDGPVARHLLVVADVVKRLTVDSLKPGFPQDWLGPWVLKRTVQTATGIAVQVGSSHTHTKPHEIHGNPWLAFESKGGGGYGAGTMVYLDARKGQIVHHPGSNMAPYLEKKLKEALDAVRGTI
jgi:hypothetical protein